MTKAKTLTHRWALVKLSILGAFALAVVALSGCQAFEGGYKDPELQKRLEELEKLIRDEYERSRQTGQLDINKVWELLGKMESLKNEVRQKGNERGYSFLEMIGTVLGSLAAVYAGKKGWTVFKNGGGK